MPNNILTLHLGNFQTDVDRAFQELESDNILNRIWKLDHTVWKPYPDEITNRLGWLWIVHHMKRNISRINNLVETVRSEGYKEVVLLGMGGSSLAPDMMRKIFGVEDGYLGLTVLDSTAPDEVLSVTERLEVENTLFIVSTKSGGTVETLSLFKYFYNIAVQKLSGEGAGSNFLAITDPGSRLETIANENKFREIFLNDPNIGGRYSALSFFGLVPAALVGINIDLLLQRATSMIENDIYGAKLGTILGLAAIAGRDKVTFLISSTFREFGDWVEQLIAESTGKEGKGILPVVSEPLADPESYGDDRLFIHIKLEEDHKNSLGINQLIESRHPVVEIHLSDVYDLGGQFFLWELATAISCHFLKVNPFNQPNVESAKELARNMVLEYQESGKFPFGRTAPLSRTLLENFLAGANTGDYISLQAYIQPTAKNLRILQELRTNLRDQYKLATTLGFGPRFLHSTGQLHKGDAGNGLFIQFITEPVKDIPIPDEVGKPGSSITFGTLILAQAIGDGQALIDENRRFIRFQLSTGDITKEINALM